MSITMSPVFVWLTLQQLQTQKYGFFFFFLFDTSFHSATALHHRKSSSLLGGYLKIIMFRLLSFMCYTPSFLSIFYKVKLFNIEMSESTEMSFL